MIPINHLGLSQLEQDVYMRHDAGMSVRMIARDLNIDVDTARYCIASVWRKDKLASKTSRATARAEFLNGLMRGDD